MFNFAIPAAKYKKDGIRALDGSLIPTLKKVRPCCRKKTLGTMNRRHLVEDTERRDGREYEHTYHATKGWRSRRVG